MSDDVPCSRRYLIKVIIETKKTLKNFRKFIIQIERFSEESQESEREQGQVNSSEKRLKLRDRSKLRTYKL